MMLASSSAISKEALMSKPPETVELTARNTFMLNTTITAASQDTWMAAAIGKEMLLMKPTDPLYIVIASSGGDYDAALMYMHVIERMPNAILICKVCNSAASMIFMASHNPRYAISKSYMLMHEMYNPHMTVRMLNNSKIVHDLTVSSNEFNFTISSVLGLSIEEYEAKIANTTWILEGEDLIKWHAADKLVKIHCDDWIKQIAPDTCSD
jgi:ATP-dependent protease ClpP protease subunit